MKPLTTPRGRSFVVVGDAAVVTIDRLTVVGDRFDSDPRIASVSVVSHPNPGPEFLRAVAPAGCAVAVATDLEALTGPLADDADSSQLAQWSRAASERGLWHDWWLTNAPDVAKSETFIELHDVDLQESSDLASSRASATQTVHLDRQGISLTIDATWLGLHQTGAQVLTTAAINALASHPNISGLRLVGIDALPGYAEHLAELDQVSIDPDPTGATDVIWYPNQIDQRVNISAARQLGRRVITTYLDLIAYDIPRYHASPDAWSAYRSMQRRIALSVDGVTTISADVAVRLMQEVPRLDPKRIQPIPLGLDHISTSRVEPGPDIAKLVEELGARPFVLVLGNDFQHKNRDFAIRVWEDVLARGANCELVLAGLHVKSSSSRDGERVLLAQHTNLRGQAHELGHVAPESREWLLANAAVVLYPSSAEGFGFVPYEASALGTPSSFATFGPLQEISGVSDTPRTWSVDAFASDVTALLGDPARAEARVSELREAIKMFTWTKFADELVEFFVRIEQHPLAAGALVGGTATDVTALAAVLGSRTRRSAQVLQKVVRLGRD